MGYTGFVKAKTRAEIEVENAIARSIAQGRRSSDFVAMAEREEAQAAEKAYGNKGAHTRDARRLRKIAAALVDAGL